MSTTEQALTNLIRLYCGQHDWIIFHANVGSVITDKSRYFDTGIPKGFPDLTILTHTGISFYIETKIHPRKPTTDQLKWQRILRGRGFVCEVCYSMSEFIEVAERIGI